MSDFKELFARLSAEDAASTFEVHFINLARKDVDARTNEAGFNRNGETRRFENKPGKFAIELQRKGKTLPGKIEIETDDETTNIIVSVIRGSDYSVNWRVDAFGAPNSPLGSMSLSDWD